MELLLSGRACDLEPVLRNALSAMQLGADTGQCERLLAYVSLLQRWNRVHNLSATLGAFGLLQQHVVDCLALVGPLRRHSGGQSLTILDAGTGGGLPAVVLAIMQRDWTVVAVDAVHKKIAFVQQAAGELRLPNLQPRHARLENLPATGERFDVVTSRAFSSLRVFVNATRDLTRSTGVWVAMKGKVPTDEIRDLPPQCQLFHVEPLLVPGLTAERCLVWLKPSQEHRSH
jgi:16S rRNA (guanine527-N7)-methyltransferase